MNRKYPFYLKSTVILFGLILLVYILFYLREVLVPLSFAMMLAILLNPLANKLQRWHIPKTWAILLSITAAFLLIASIGYFLSIEIAGFSDQLPALKKKFAELSIEFQHSVKQQFGINMQRQNQYLNEAEDGLKPLLGETVGTVMGTLGIVFLLPVYTFLLLYYKTLIINFLYEVFAEENSTNLSEVLNQTRGAIQRYTFGILLEAIIVASLNAAALLIIGVDYAILLGILGAILNVLPFIGGILAVILPLIIATVTHQGFQTQLFIMASYIIIQFIDNHVLVPYIVSSRVKINALASIIIVLLGGMVWGVSGMFLSIPFIGILKIIFDQIPDLKPWGRFLGTEVPTRHKGQLWSLRKKYRSNHY